MPKTLVTCDSTIAISPEKAKEYGLRVLPLNVIITMAITQVILKVSYEIIMLPITKLVVKKAKAYEEKI